MPLHEPRPSFGLTARMLVGSCLLGLVVVTAFGVMLLALRESGKATALADRAQRIEAAAYEIERRVVDLETGQRGFALTEQEAFLAPWREARVALPPLRRALTGWIVDERQAARARALFAGLDAYIAQWSVPSVALARRDPDAARRAIAAGEGRRRMEALRAGFADFHRAERALVVARSARADRYRGAALTAGSVGLVGSALLVVVFAAYLSRAVVLPTRRLAQAAGRISSGDLAARVPEGGVAELDGLARAFNRMADHVQRSRAELERQGEELRQLDRLKDDFVATVSHELRTPLTSMVGFLELLQEPASGELSDEQREFLEIVARNATRLTRLVGDLLFVARLDADKLELDLADVDVAALLGDALASAGPAAAHRGVRLDLEVAAGLAPLRADAARLAQLVDNLVTNAVKFTPEGGRVAVRAGAADGVLRIAVEDSGIGIAADELGRLTERFFRASSATARAISGTGLGLAISRAIVEAHGGSLDVASELGAGSTFTVELPLAPAAALAA